VWKKVILFYPKTNYAVRCVLIFYKAGAVTRDRRIGTLGRFFKKMLRRISNFELSWVVQLFKHLFYIFRKRANLGRTALELGATPQPG
jgi:hypothetical protein